MPTATKAWQSWLRCPIGRRPTRLEPLPVELVTTAHRLLRHAVLPADEVAAQHEYQYRHNDGREQDVNRGEVVGNRLHGQDPKMQKR